MRRWPSRIRLLASISILAACAAAWIASAHGSLEAGWEQFNDGDTIWLKADHAFVSAGRIGFLHFRRVETDWWANNRPSSKRGGWFIRQRNEPYDPIGDFQRRKSLFDVAGFSFTNNKSVDSAERLTVQAVEVPLWFLALLSAIVPVRYLLHRARCAPGKCQVCGYDLRATPERCPECGMETVG